MKAADDLQRIANTMRQECIAMCVRRLNRRITRIYDDALRPLGVGTAQLNIIIALAIAGASGARQTDIARALGLEKSTLSRNLDRMLDRGWIGAGPDDNGGARLRLRPAGRRVMKQALPAWRTAQQRASTELHLDLVEALTRAARASGPRDPQGSTPA